MYTVLLQFFFNNSIFYFNKLFQIDILIYRYSDTKHNHGQCLTNVNQITAAEMKYLRKVHGKTRRGRTSAI